jgi:hypothetical protein
MPRRSLSDNGLAFLAAIIGAQAWDAELIATFLEKPHKWDDEYALWFRNGAPTIPGEPDFERWVAAMDVL